MIVLKAKGFEVRKPAGPGALGQALDEVAGFIAKHVDQTVEVWQDGRRIGIYDRHNVPV